jgi:hypothetical protein
MKQTDNSIVAVIPKIIDLIMVLFFHAEECTTYKMPRMFLPYFNSEC